QGRADRDARSLERRRPGRAGDLPVGHVVQRRASALRARLRAAGRVRGSFLAEPGASPAVRLKQDHRTLRNSGQLSPPRRRGGVPKTDSGVAPMSPSSPPTRGCSAVGDVRGGGGVVLPADAGVFRRPSPRSADRRRPPRRRGGVPPLEMCAVGVPWSSPPTRGCSVASAARLIGRLVLPADAGVFRWTTRSRQGSRRPPRRRGGVPNSSVEPAFQLWSSPPTRGCSAGRDLGVVAHAVLPADAGVFRSPAPNCCAPPSPPRRRGGVPVSALFAAVVSASSPPTRGCSDAGRLPVLGEGVLPADAGCSVMLSPSVNISNVLPADAGVFRRAPSSDRKSVG